jgi:hypothetical protein
LGPALSSSRQPGSLPGFAPELDGDEGRGGEFIPGGVSRYCIHMPLPFGSYSTHDVLFRGLGMRRGGCLQLFRALMKSMKTYHH